jgi:thiol-disulfide isomerase/thioredoxin
MWKIRVPVQFLIAMVLLAACSQANSAESGGDLVVDASPKDSQPEPLTNITPVPLATSRGNKLEASDLASINIGNGQPVLIEFFRFTWTTCQSMAPMVHGLEAKYFTNLNFYYLDADDPATKSFQKKYGFQYQPYFVLLNGEGKELKRWAGYVSQNEFETAFVDYLK